MAQERGTEPPEQQPEWGDESVADRAEAPEAAEAREVVEAESADDDAACEDYSPERLTVLLEDARAKADESWNQLLRARAEMENFKRRQANELEKAHKFALDGFVRELLQVRDSLELGHDAALDESADVAKLREGTELTLKLLTDVMGKFGVEQVDPQGEPFNPDYHQAMTTQPRDDVPPNTVVTVVQKGYLLNGRLVRPAMVIVSAAASPQQS
ncbi:MAG: nucleotide exchange factor GrpE [Chromatiaceae bacterium]|jgi:molecular chaperone GrpE|nr:nucleotide exchange factor GrpE [Chromatiaceae bacterium]